MRRKQFGRWQHVGYMDSEEFDEFADMCQPVNMGHRHVHEQEWDDYILEEQLLWIEELSVMEPEPPLKRGRVRGKVYPPSGSRKRKMLGMQDASWLLMYVAF